METTLTLRNRLGFNEVALWKQFCARRLHLIHTLSLNLRKASEQEEQVRVLAAELCAEYGFGPYAQGDFEKLLIAGIQSVRRNQKRSARHPNGYSESQSSIDSSSNRQTQNGDSASNGSTETSTTTPNKPTTTTHGVVAVSTAPLGVHSSTLPNGSQYFEPIAHFPDPPSLIVQHGGPNAERSPAVPEPYPHLSGDRNMPSAVPVAAEAGASASHPQNNLNRNPPAAGPLATPMFQSLVVRLEVLRDMIGAGSATWIESSAPTVAHMSAYGVLSTAVAAASVHGKLTSAESTAMRDSILEGPLLESLRLALNPGLTQTRLLERIGALAASLVHGPHLLSALQALCVSLAQASHGSENDMRFMLRPLARTDPSDDKQQQSNSQSATTPQQVQQPPHQLSAQPPQPQPASQPQPPQDPKPIQPFISHIPQVVPQHMLPQPMIPQPVITVPHVASHDILASRAKPMAPYMLQRNPHSSSMPAIYSSEQPPPPMVPVGQPFPSALPSINSAVQSPPKVESPEDASTKSSSSSGSVSSASSNSSVGIHVSGPDRLVTLQFNDKVLQLIYSPLKATPPTISEIIDNARKSFSISPMTVVRVKDVQRNKIIETNSELIDAFTQEKVKLELLLPPPMLMTMEPKEDLLSKETKYTHLAPILRKSA